MSTGIYDSISGTGIFFGSSSTSFYHLLGGANSTWYWTAPTLTFSFPAVSSNYHYEIYGLYSEFEPNGFARVNFATQTAVRDILSSLERIIDLDFVEVVDSGSGTGDLRFGLTTKVDADRFGGWAYFPDDAAIGGDVWLPADQWTASGSYSFDPEVGNYEYLTLVHEIGHALGLSHPFETSSSWSSSRYAPLHYSVMNYWSKGGGTYNVYPTSFSQLDILALWELYGKNTTASAGNDNYTYEADGKYLEVLWDAGGNDTLYYASGTSAAVINLTPGSWSRLGAEVKRNGSRVSNLFIMDDPDSATDLIENAISGSGNDLITGNSAANRLEGGGGADTIDGGTGADTMIGGSGNDVYHVDEVGDVVSEAAFGGTDLVYSKIDHVLGDHVEHLILVGTATANATGNALANRLTGNAGTNTLDGGAGVDTLVGGNGNDTYFVDSMTKGADGTLTVALEDSVTEAAGVDWLKLRGEHLGLAIAGSFTLSTIEHLDASDTGATWLNLTGNAANNSLIGNQGDNVLNGGAGSDTLTGGLGNDTYVVNSAGDVVVELSGEGTDTLLWGWGVAGGSLTLDEPFENARLTNAVAFGLVGNAAQNWLWGNAASNVIEGHDGSDTLDGGAGADSLAGGAGDDLYVVDNGGDKVTEAADEGTDHVQASVSFTLGEHVEKLTLIGTAAINGIGNGLANFIAGNAAANKLDGGAGIDTLVGGAGNDTYVVDDSDVVVEDMAAGIDTVMSAINYTLASTLERLILTGTADLSGTGNEVSNIITGNAGANALDGLGAADTLIGGAGNDVYTVDLIGTSAYAKLEDAVVEVAGQGNDMLILRGSVAGLTSAATITLSAYLEGLDTSATGWTKLNLIGNANANRLIGNDADNLLNGGAAADVVIGGDGNDSYVVDNVLDQVSEQAGQGVDHVSVAIATANGSYTLGDHFEAASLSNAVAYRLIGNGLSNTLKGNAAVNTLDGRDGDDTLDGAAGADSLIGGDGDDLYRVDNVADKVIEEASEGVDHVLASVTFTLADNVENLTLLGTAINGTGNALSNVIVGNAAANKLDGGLGADTLDGGAGNDTYVVDDVGDVLIDSAGTDLVRSSIDFTLADGFEKLVLLGTAVSGTGNGGGNSLTGNDEGNTLDGGGGVDALIGGKGDDVYTVDLVKVGTDSTAYVRLQDLVTELAGQGNDKIVLRGVVGDLNKATLLTLGATLEHFDASDTGSTKLNLTGNGSANLLIGNDEANVLSGLAGADTLRGEAGGDTLIGGAGGDTLNGGDGADIFRFALTSECGDLIEDFTVGTDKIQLVGKNFGGLTTDNLGTRFDDTGVAPALGWLAYSSTTGELRFGASTGSLLVATIGTGLSFGTSDIQIVTV